ncbi:SCO family protein [Marinobacterium lutimaris]|uniref:Protein SCO1/2 n=1 Tax=Marinobacterium lutimaris TaxID=568106 RepID=A0A1H6C4C3_9GAMM|nr:SCO family protein [Marinobacterium lutimaris]SEG67557.1 protein SCO1/2 [Marinobacterium lutimaris]
MNKKIALILFPLTFLLGLALPFLPAWTDRDDYYGIAVDNPVPPLELADSQIDNGLRVLFFGYRNCGTVCPAQIVNLVQLQQRLRGHPVEFVFITLDPERDSEEVLQRAASVFGPSFKVVRPESTLLAQNLALAYGDTAARVQSATGYEFDHTANLYVVTTGWRKRLIYTQPVLDLDRMESDLQKLLQTI